MNKPVRILLLTLMFTVCLVAPAQQAIYRQGTTAERAARTPAAAGGYVFVPCAISELPDAGNSVIYRYDMQGNSDRISYGRYIWATQRTLDDKLLVLSQQRRCSWKPDTLKYSVEKIDTNAQVIASAPLDNGSGLMVQNADSAYLIFLWDNKTLVRLDKNLNQVAKITHTLGTVQGGVLCKNGQVMVSHMSNTGNRLSLLNASGQVVSSQTVAVVLPELHLFGAQQVTGYAGNAFYFYDYSVNLVQVKNFPKVVFDYFTGNDSIYVIMQDQQPGNVAYAVLNSSLHIVHIAAISNYAATALCGVGSRVAILSDPDVISYGWLGHCFSLSGKLGGFQSSKNLVLSSAKIDSSYYVPRPDGFYDVYARLNYQVYNGGPSVSKFNIVVELDPGTTCGKNYSRVQYSVTIPQGGSFSAQSPGFLKKQGKKVKEVITFTFCPVLEAPDGEFDATPNDNIWCLVDGLDINALSENGVFPGLKVFPNPSSGRVEVSGEAVITKIGLWDLLGRCHGEYQVGDFRSTIDLSGYNAGIYLVRVHSPAGVATRRLVLNAD